MSGSLPVISNANRGQRGSEYSEGNAIKDAHSRAEGENARGESHAQIPNQVHRSAHTKEFRPTPFAIHEPHHDPDETCPEKDDQRERGGFFGPHAFLPCV